MNASHAELEFMKQSLSNFNEIIHKEAEDFININSQNNFTSRIDEKDNESDEEYNDDFEEIDDDIEEIPSKKMVKSQSEDSIEEELNIDEDEEGSDIDVRMEKMELNQVENKYTSMNAPVMASKKRAISAKYQLRSLKHPVSKIHRVMNNDQLKK